MTRSLLAPSEKILFCVCFADGPFCFARILLLLVVGYAHHIIEQKSPAPLDFAAPFSVQRRTSLP